MDIKQLIKNKTVNGYLGNIRVTVKRSDDFAGEWQERSIMRELKEAV
jgi:hypothetical protein